MASKRVRRGCDCSDTIEETSSDKGLLLRSNLRSKRGSRNYSVSHMQQHTCHSLPVIVVVMNTWCFCVRWCEMTAAFELFKCRATGLGGHALCARKGSLFVSRLRRSQGRYTQADMRVSAWEKLGIQASGARKRPHNGTPRATNSHQRSRRRSPGEPRLHHSFSSKPTARRHPSSAADSSSRISNSDAQFQKTSPPDVWRSSLILSSGPRCIVPRCATAWAESLEGALNGH